MKYEKFHKIGKKKVLINNKIVTKLQNLIDKHEKVDNNLTSNIKILKRCLP